MSICQATTFSEFGGVALKVSDINVVWPCKNQIPEDLQIYEVKIA